MEWRQFCFVGSSFCKTQMSPAAPGEQQVHISWEAWRDILSNIRETSLLAIRYAPFETQKLETILIILISEAGIFKYLLDLHSCKGVPI